MQRAVRAVRAARAVHTKLLPHFPLCFHFQISTHRTETNRKVFAEFPVFEAPSKLPMTYQRFRFPCNYLFAYSPPFFSVFSAASFLAPAQPRLKFLQRISAAPCELGTEPLSCAHQNPETLTFETTSPARCSFVLFCDFWKQLAQVDAPASSWSAVPIIRAKPQRQNASAHLCHSIPVLKRWLKNATVQALIRLIFVVQSETFAVTLPLVCPRACSFTHCQCNTEKQNLTWLQLIDQSQCSKQILHDFTKPPFWDASNCPVNPLPKWQNSEHNPRFGDAQIVGSDVFIVRRTG